ncbi:MAG TPA: 16S rRNA (guanine(527)-N(7))-methyltransferase RsmG [Chthonomonadaceae bacterium]|nr:16S rRNA (guanine(527)-N(7))-methyltransferase RsmG [Chthonomonadaceae bacterium]
MLTESQRAHLAEGAALWGIPLNAQTLDRFARFATLLEEGNRRLNLTRVPAEEVVALHFLDSLALAAVFRPEPGTQALDVGTGAGFPGVPLALAFPDLQMTLLDATRKRLVFLEEAVADLGLSNVRVLHGRAEDLARDPQHREHYGLVTARAVAKMGVLAGWLLPLVCLKGVAVTYKSREAGEEIANARPQIEALGGRIERVVDVVLPRTDILRKLAVIRKQRPTPLRLSRPSVRRG